MPGRRNIVVSVIFRVLVCAALLIAAGLVFWWLAGTRPKPDSTGFGQTPPRVVVMHAQPVPVRRQWEGFGTARALISADVPARVTATVIEKSPTIQPGIVVARGQPLVRLDDSDFMRQVEIASQTIQDVDAQLARLQVEEQSWTRRAELAAEDVRLACAEYDRVRQAFESEAAKQRELDQARQALNTAERAAVAAREELDKISPRRASLRAQRIAEESSLRLATQNVERSSIASPIDGVLQAVDVEIGESVAAGQRIARIINLERIEVPLLLPASARSDVAAGDDVTLIDAGASGQTWTGTVARIGPEDDEASRTMRVYVELQQQFSENSLLAPGKFVQGVVVSSQPQDRWVVPRRAVDGQRIMLIKDGVIKSFEIDVDFQIQAELPQFGLVDRQWTVLKNALPSEAMIVVDASRQLAEGSAAVPVEASAVAVRPTQETAQ